MFIVLTELGRLKSHLKREDPSFLQPRFPFNEICIVLNLIEIGIVCLKLGNECLLFGYYHLLEKDVVLEQIRTLHKDAFDQVRLKLGQWLLKKRTDIARTTED